MLLCLLVVCCDVYPGLGLNCMQDSGVEETPNGIDKPSAERNLTKITFLSDYNDDKYCFV